MDSLPLSHQGSPLIIYTFMEKKKAILLSTLKADV